MVVILFCTPKILLLWVILFLGYPVGLKSFRERYCSSPTGLQERLTFEIVKERCSLITLFAGVLLGFIGSYVHCFGLGFHP